MYRLHGKPSNNVFEERIVSTQMKIVIQEGHHFWNIVPWLLHICSALRRTSAVVTGTKWVPCHLSLWKGSMGQKNGCRLHAEDETGSPRRQWETAICQHHSPNCVSLLSSLEEPPPAEAELLSRSCSRSNAPNLLCLFSTESNAVTADHVVEERSRFQIEHGRNGLWKRTLRKKYYIFVGPLWMHCWRVED